MNTRRTTYVRAYEQKKIKADSSWRDTPGLKPDRIGSEVQPGGKNWKFTDWNLKNTFILLSFLSNHIYEYCYKVDEISVGTGPTSRRRSGRTGWKFWKTSLLTLFSVIKTKISHIFLVECVKKSVQNTCYF